MLRKGKQQISKEIPQRGGTHGKDLAEVEIPFQFTVEQPYRKGVDAQSNNGDAEVFGIFYAYLWVGALKGPPAVEEVVGGGGHDEAQDVAQIFVQFQPFLTDVSNAEIDEHA